jgi:hypothetical protein
VAVALFGAVPFYILLAHAGSDLSSSAVSAALVKAIASAAVVLAGIAPATALLVTSTEGEWAAGLYAALGLALAGAIGLRSLCRDLLGGESCMTVRAQAAVVGFAVFAALLSGRVWWSLLPVLGGAS